MTKYNGAIVLLNALNEPIANIEFPRAVRLLMRKVAVVVEGDESRLIDGVHPWPKVMRMIRYVFEKWLDKPAHWHRGGVFIRDRHKCAYCGKKAETIDHVYPKARGGLWSWENCVAACGGAGGCNGRKGSRTPEEAGMPLRFAKPYVPTVRELQLLASGA